MNKIILDLCGGTGAWSRPYKEAGFDVQVITLPDHDVTKVFYQPNYVSFPIGDTGVVKNIELKNIYGILAAPPCTEFSRAKSTVPRNFTVGLVVVQACLDLIWTVQKDHRLAFWALENPMGMLRRFLGRPAYSFEPWWFGDSHSKQTDLWGWFNEPRQTVFERPATVERAYHNKNSRFYSSPKCPDEYKHLKLDRAGIRSITPPGFAQAFYRANK